MAYVLVGLVVLAWSSGLFVDGAASLARALGISPLVVGMVVIGFGTSAPELCVSVLSGLGGHSNLSLGNAYGSDIFNIACILGVSVLIYPLLVRPKVSVVAGAGLSAITVFAMLVVRDGACTRAEAWALIGAFLVLMPLYCWYDQATRRPAPPPPPTAARRDVRSLAVDAVKLVVGLAMLIFSSRLLVDGAVDVARWLGVSDLVIGLTVVAVGTSLPELASAVASAKPRPAPRRRSAARSSPGSGAPSPVRTGGTSVAKRSSSVSARRMSTGSPSGITSHSALRSLPL